MSKEIFLVTQHPGSRHGALHGGHTFLLWRTTLREANCIDFSAIIKYDSLVLVDKPNCKTFRVFYIIYVFKICYIDNIYSF